MPTQFAMSATTIAGVFLWAVFAFLFWKKSLIQRFPAMAAYLGLHLVATPFLTAVTHFSFLPGYEFLNGVYFYGHYGMYIASAVLTLFVCLEIFRASLAAFPGLLKIGIVIFRWAILVSVILTFSSISFLHRGVLVIPDIAYGLMRSASILELCLLAFLCLSMGALRLTVRDIAFGIALGFGLMSANDFALASFVSAHMTLTAPLELAYQALCLVSIGIWIAYCAFPSKAGKPVLMPATSAIYRWNEIASALGHNGAQVAMQQSSSGFFLSDVELVVDKVLTRNLKSSESEL